ncbi:Uncharacterised protein [uncultured archaeon]|nr:Uncharacterised protein [uncultured archaeon]
MADENPGEQLNYVKDLMESILEDSSVPRNIRKAIEDAKIKIGQSESLSVGITGAIYMLEDISNDINMPSHTRTEIWTIISELESLREKHKG